MSETLTGGGVVLPLAGTALPTTIPSPTQLPGQGSARAQASTRTHPRRHSGPFASGPFSIIGPFERAIAFVPTAIWILLGALALVAAAAGAAAYRSAGVARRHARTVATVSAEALTDQLTGVLNRRGFIAAFERELDRAQRYGRPLALAFLDVRGLKLINDSHGHLAGDRLLRTVAALLTESARAHDVVGRIGGDELAVLLPEQSAAGVARVIQRVRAQIPPRRAQLGYAPQWDLTVGVALYPEDGDAVENLFGTADRRLYEQRGIELR